MTTAVAVAIVLVSLVVFVLVFRWIWNRTVPAVFGLKEITFWQAVGILHPRLDPHRRASRRQQRHHQHHRRAEARGGRVGDDDAAVLNLENDRESAMAGVLEGIRVLDFGRYIAGPYCAALLAEHGAEVIRIEKRRGQRGPLPGAGRRDRRRRAVPADEPQQAAA